MAPGVKVDDVVSYREIYPENKSKHFKKLHKDSGVAYRDMLFFDDCNWGDNCRDVQWACPGVVAVKTPHGLRPQDWADVSSDDLQVPCSCVDPSRVVRGVEMLPLAKSSQWFLVIQAGQL